MSNNKSLSFGEMLWSFSPLKLINCPEFYVSLLIPTVIFYFMFYTTNQQQNILRLETVKLLIGVDATILAVVITGLAILLSITDSKFIKLLVDTKNLYTRFFFPFYLSSILWGIHLIFSLMMFFALNTFITSQIKVMLQVSFFIYIFWFLYALLNSLSLVGIIIRLGEKKAEFDENEQKGHLSPKRGDPQN